MAYFSFSFFIYLLQGRERFSDILIFLSIVQNLRKYRLENDRVNNTNEEISKEVKEYKDEKLTYLAEKLYELHSFCWKC